MKRRYFVNRKQESREYFLSLLGFISVQEFELLQNGGTLYKNDNYFRIENYGGI